MSVYVHGLGAVSPAGWSVDSLRDALAKGEPLPVQSIAGPAGTAPVRMRKVPPPAVRPTFLSHARLRRSSPIAQFAVAAALEAIGDDVPRVREGGLRLGIVVCVMAGCVNYTRRFYAETLQDPLTASPLVFPETVFNSPASHLAAYLNSTGIAYTLVGDSGTFLVGLALAGRWIEAGLADVCVVVGAEEGDWMVADASRRFCRASIVSEGAGAVYLRGTSDRTCPVQLDAVTDPETYGPANRPREAALAMRAQLPPSAGGELLCDGMQGWPRLDAAERNVWSDWSGVRLSPKRVLGEGLAAASAWQCVAAVDGLREGHAPGAIVSVVGQNQQAIAARFLVEIQRSIPAQQRGMLWKT